MNTEIIISDKEMLTDDIWLTLENIEGLPDFPKESEKSLSQELFFGDDTPSDVLSEMNIAEDIRFGKYFRLESQPQPQQQQDRIVICGHGSYPKVINYTPPPKIPQLVVVSIHCIGSEYDRQLLISDWTSGATEMEIKPKNPRKSSYLLKIKKGVLTGFVLKIRIFSYGDNKDSFTLLDEFNTTSFKIVAHSMLCMETRRGIKGAVKRRENKKSKETSSEDESDDPKDESY